MKNRTQLIIGIVLLTLMFVSVGWSQSSADIVLIIDSSGSMTTNDPNDLRKNAAQLFIGLAASDTQIDIQIGVIDFDDWARPVAPLTRVDPAGKTELEIAVGQINSDGGTNITAGLQVGFDVLSEATDQGGRKAAVLLTDGEDNSNTQPVVSNYFAQNWSIYTIGLGGGINRAKLETIARDTPQGEYFQADRVTIQEIYNAIFAKVTRKSVLANLSGYINQEQSISKNVSIDPGITQTNISVSWQGSTIGTALVDPSGREITPDTADALGIGYQVAPTFAIYTIENPMSGEWQMRITGTDIPPEGEPYSLLVTGASDFVTNFLAFEPSYAIADTVRIGIRIEEKTGDTAQPVLGAAASATIIRPDGRIETIDLFDDGTHNDNAAGDGVYTADYVNLDVLGAYLIRASAQTDFSREIQHQFVVGALDNVFVDGATLVPAAGATLRRTPKIISAVISGPAGNIDSRSIVLKIDGTVAAYTYDDINQIVSFKPVKMSRGIHTVSLSVNDSVETNWSFEVQSGGDTRFDLLMVLLGEELNLLEAPPIAAAAPSLGTQAAAPAFVVHCDLEGISPNAHWALTAKNLRTGATAIPGKAAWTTLNHGSAVQVGDILAVELRAADGTIIAGPHLHTVSSADIYNASVRVQLTVRDVQRKETRLGQNYPNPFNPETWIPYQLREPTEVSIQIYDGSGHLVRTLNVGMKPAGTYRTRHRATFWNGKNEKGEPVASGVYFYTLQTPEFSATRRMLILK